ncbi:MAG: hypothetical protein R3C69_12700 [Geminicoccaceae bacterium]
MSRSCVTAAKEAMVLSDRMAVMRDGLLQQIGPPMEVYREPVNLFVASFIGSPAMNFLDVELVREGNTLLCRFAERTLRLALGSVSEASLKSLDRPKKALLGIRPSDLLVGGSAREQTIEGRVFLVEPVGPVTFLDVDVEGQVVKAACDPDGTGGRRGGAPRLRRQPRSPLRSGDGAAFLDEGGGRHISEEKRRCAGSRWRLSAPAHGARTMPLSRPIDPVDLQYICDLDGDRARRLAEKVGGWTDRIEEIASSDVEGGEHRHAGPCPQGPLPRHDRGRQAHPGREAVHHRSRRGPRDHRRRRAERCQAHGRFPGYAGTAYMGAKHFMESGELGEGVMGYARLSDTIHVPTEMLSWGSASGPEWFLFPHTMDVTRWILDESRSRSSPAAASRVLKGMGIDAYDAIQALFQFERSFICASDRLDHPGWLSHRGRQQVHAARQQGPDRARQHAPGSPSPATATNIPSRAMHHPLRQTFAHFYRSIRHFADCVLEDRGARGHRP